MVSCSTHFPCPGQGPCPHGIRCLRGSPLHPVRTMMHQRNRKQRRDGKKQPASKLSRHYTANVALGFRRKAPPQLGRPYSADERGKSKSALRRVGFIESLMNHIECHSRS